MIGKASQLPKWLSKANVQRLQSMNPEDAGAEVARLYEQHKEKRRAWRAANKEKEYASQLKWRAKNAKKVRAINARSKAGRRATPEGRASLTATFKAWKDRTGYKAPKISKDQAKQYDAQRYQRKKTQNLAREKPDVLRAAIQKRLPGYLTPPARMDITSSVMELALAHQVRHDQLAETVKACVTAYNRQFDYFKNVSIDAPIAGTDGLTRADMLDADTFHF